MKKKGFELIAKISSRFIIPGFEKKVYSMTITDGFGDHLFGTPTYIVTVWVIVPIPCFAILLIWTKPQ